MTFQLRKRAKPRKRRRNYTCLFQTGQWYPAKIETSGDHATSYRGLTRIIQAHSVRLTGDPRRAPPTTTYDARQRSKHTRRGRSVGTSAKGPHAVHPSPLLVRLVAVALVTPFSSPPEHGVPSYPSCKVIRTSRLCQLNAWWIHYISQEVPLLVTLCP